MSTKNSSRFTPVIIAAFILFSRKEEDFCGERDFFFYSCRWKMQKYFRTS